MKCRTTRARARRAGTTFFTGATANMRASAPARTAASLPTDAGVQPSRNAIPRRWAARVEATGSGNVEMIELARAEQADEMLLMGLRLSEGIDLGRLELLGNMRLDPAVVDELVGLGLLQVSNARRF